MYKTKVKYITENIDLNKDIGMGMEVEAGEGRI